MRLAGFLIFAVCAARAGEHAVLTNGARLYAERHESEGGKVRLYAPGGGFTELDSALIAGFEQMETAAPPVPPPPPPVAPVVQALSAPDPRQLVDEAADRYRLPRALVHSVVKAESAYRPAAVSPKGAIGLMQLMPGTARQLGADPYDPRQNVDAGTRHLRDLLLKYEGGLHRALAAYNAGAGAVEKYRGVPPYAETVGYIRRIVRDSGLDKVN